METLIEGARLLLGLKARLEMDAELGIHYLDINTDTSACFRTLTTAQQRTPSSTPKATQQRFTVPAAIEHEMRTAPQPTPAAKRPLTAPPSTPLPDGYISLVPFKPSAANAEKEALLSDLRNECLSCTACGLCERRTNVAWGEGSLNAEVMFIGEGPGKDEDREGRPFVGRSGRLLTDIIEKGMKLSRSEVYIANVVKCRPPGNRDPKPDEVAACARYLNRQIEVIAPRAIVAVGGVAGCALLGHPPRTPGLRGKWHMYKGLPLRVIYHPSYLLRQRRNENDRTDADRTTWQDIQEVMAKLRDA